MRERERPSGEVYDYPIYVGNNYLFGSPYGADKVINSGPYSWRYEKCYDQVHPGPPYRTGGPFDLYERVTNRNILVPKEPIYVDYGNYGYNGQFYPAYWNNSSWLGFDGLDEFIQTDYGNAFSWGAIGWDRLRPTRPKASLGQFIGEFRDFPRMLRQTAKLFHKKWLRAGGLRNLFKIKNKGKESANHWLNYQFGWLPFLNDLRSLHVATVELDKNLHDLQAQNDSWVERSGTLNVEDSGKEVVYEVDKQPGLQPLLNTYLYRKIDGIRYYGHRRVTKRITSRVWFSARFRYYVPPWKQEWHWKASAIAHLYGLRPVPSLIWELTPWSWLVDWWTNAGSVLASIESIALDNLAAKYAYVMATTEHRIDYEGSIYLVDGYTIKAPYYDRYIRKTRVEASPFGFGLTSDDFSARQWSILSALGLGRLRFK